MFSIRTFNSLLHFLSDLKLTANQGLQILTLIHSKTTISLQDAVFFDLTIFHRRFLAGLFDAGVGVKPFSFHGGFLVLLFLGSCRTFLFISFTFQVLFYGLKEISNKSVISLTVESTLLDTLLNLFVFPCDGHGMVDDLHNFICRKGCSFLSSCKILLSRRSIPKVC